jgi:hypothetical protein
MFYVSGVGTSYSSFPALLWPFCTSSSQFKSDYPLQSYAGFYSLHILQEYWSDLDYACLSRIYKDLDFTASFLSIFGSIKYVTSFRKLIYATLNPVLFQFFEIELPHPYRTQLPIPSGHNLTLQTSGVIKPEWESVLQLNSLLSFTHILAVYCWCKFVSWQLKLISYSHLWICIIVYVSRAYVFYLN